MKYSCKGNIYHTILALLMFSLCYNSYGLKHNDNYKYLSFSTRYNKSYELISSDTIPLRKDSIPIASGDSLLGPVSYKATDSIVYDIPLNSIYLYGKGSQIFYLDNELTAPLIIYNQSNNTVKANLIKDSSGKVVEFPTYVQSDFKSISDTIVFNMKTGKGITKGTYTQQGEMFVYGSVMKKIDKDIFYANNGRFTTCNLDTPHFAFVSSKVKFINKKTAFTGPVHPEMEGVPLPIVLPFGIYPLKTGMHSGLLAPNFTANEQLGLAMEGLGYYKIINDYWDVVTRGTLYSYGGWSANISPRYFRKYRFQGGMGLDLQRFKNGFKGDPDFSTSQTFNIRWNHSADSKARPGVTFSANVNAGSSKFNAQVPNNPQRNITNQLNSSITYSKVWKDKPFNLSVSANHNQNTSQRLININLPDVAFNVNTIYPFRRKEVIGEYKWYENLGFALNTNARSLSSFIDTATDAMSQLSKNLKWGASHSVPITLSLPSLGPLQVAPSVSYQEHWYQEKFIRRWNPNTNKVDTVIQNGLYTARDMNFGLGVTSRIFGMFGFKRSSKVQAIRHEIRPTISVSYKPNMNAASYYKTQIDNQGNTAKFSYYERSIYGAFSDTKFAGLNFGIDNVLQMKVRQSHDTSAALKKVSLIDGLGITGSYNFMLDSFQMSNLNMNVRSTLFNKISITGNAIFDPYLYNEQGRRINKLVWTKNPLSLGQMMSGGVSLQGSWRGGGENAQASNVKNRAQQAGMSQANPGMMDEFNRDAAYIQNNPGQYADFNIPWDINISYSLRYSKSPDYRNPGSFNKQISQDAMWSGSINLTPKWKLGLNSSYNFTTKELGMMMLNISRDLHCWQMTINISPVGRFRFFTLNISPKSGMLRDIRVNRTRYFYEL